jgi:hypothetical protein
MKKIIYLKNDLQKLEVWAKDWGMLFQRDEMLHT